MNYTTLASDEVIFATQAALKANNVESLVVDTKEQALEKIKELIPKGASVMNGSSRTLDQIGYIEYLKAGQHGWDNLHAAIVAETDPAKQAAMRRQALLSDYYLGSVHAAAKTGELVIGSNSGSQMPHIVYSSPNVIFVVSTQKIMPTLDAARARLLEHVVPLEDARLLEAHKMHTKLNKEIIFHGESSFTGRKILVLFVKEALGF